MTTKLETKPTRPASPPKAEVKGAAPKSESALKSFVSGGVGGACCVLVGHPLDLVKVRMQTGGAGGSVFGMLSDTLRKEGVRGIYRGVSAPLTTVSPMFAVSFWSYDIGQRMVKSYGQWGMTEEERSRPYVLSMGEICMAGAFSAIPTTGIMAPTERIKCLLQVQGGEVERGAKPKYSGMLDCTRQVLKEGGVQSLYKGPWQRCCATSPAPWRTSARTSSSRRS